MNMVDTQRGAEVDIEFTDVVRRRRMVRDFEDRAIEADIVERILTNSLRGPSAGFTQGVDLLVLEGRAETSRFWVASIAEDAAHSRWTGMRNAPVIVVVVADSGAYRRRFGEPDKASRLDVPWWLVDASFAAMLMLLGAVDVGLGASFFRVNDPVNVRREFGIPEAHDVVGAVAIGHPGNVRPSRSAARGRRPATEAVHKGNW